MKKYGNKSIVADLLGVNRRTVIRFLQKHPIPQTFVIEESMNLKDFPEMRIWLKRIAGFAGNNTISSYMTALRKFYAYMKKNHLERAKPSLWTSDDILEFIKTIPEYNQHANIVPLRSLALKAQIEFPNIDLGLLPTKRTHKAKRSLAGVKEYYYTPQEVDRMIEVAEEKRDKAMMAVLYNLAPRTLALINILIENIDLEKHYARIADKGGIIWETYGMTDKTKRLISEYLEERGYPTSGLLFVNSNGNGETKMTHDDVNNAIRKWGKRAGIKGKVLTAKAFRKSFVENFMNIPDANPLVIAGTGKETKTCFCVGWTLDVVMKHYAPKMKKQIKAQRQKFHF